MNLKTIFWPWGQLIDLEREVAEAQQEAVKAKDEAKRVGRALKEVLGELAAAKRGNLIGDAKIAKLRAKLAEGHFRNPKTGRLGHKGETFE